MPLFCAHFLKPIHEAAEEESHEKSWGARFHARFNEKFEKMLDFYQRWVEKALDRPGLTVAAVIGLFVISLGLYPLVGVAFFPRTDAGQFIINLKAPTGTRIELTNEYVKRVEEIVRHVVPPKDLNAIVSNIGVYPDLSALFTQNAAMHTAFVEVGLTEDHSGSSFTYMSEVRGEIQKEIPELRTYFQSGGLVDSVLNQGMPAPIDVQVSGQDLPTVNGIAQDLTRRFSGIRGVSDVYVPQDMDYPGLQMNVNRVRAAELGLSPQEVIDNVITSLTSDVMIAPSYWVDSRSGNNYFVEDLKAMPLRAPSIKLPTYLSEVADIQPIPTPTEVDHYQLEREMDIYVAPSGEDLGKPRSEIDKIIKDMHIPSNIRIDVRGLVVTMDQSFRSFGFGLLLAILLVYLILVAQFTSFIDPLLIVLAVPTGLTGVMLTLAFTDTTLNIQSLMGIVMLQGMVVSNSILIVDFAKVLRGQNHTLREAVVQACRIRLRPILMTSLATIVGLLPMALKLETGSEAYAPLARVIIGGLIASVVLTIFIVPAAYLILYRRSTESQAPAVPQEALS